MKNINIGNSLNSMSMETEDKDDEDVFLDSLNQAMSIASGTVKSNPSIQLVPACV